MNMYIRSDETKVCPICEKEFLALGSGKRKYCSVECAKTYERNKARERYYRRGYNLAKKVNTEYAKESHATLAEINAQARAMGLSYGQYVARGYMLTNRG